MSSTKKFTPPPILASIDAGGTTFKCALIQEGEGVITSLRVPTTSPDDTLDACALFFKVQQSKGFAAAAMGIASFGPLNVDPLSGNHGEVEEGPKAGWAGTNLKVYFEKALSIPVAIDTDVNGALLAEMIWGAAQGKKTAAYLTIGTGIGAGLFSNGALIGKPLHPEFGHIRVQRHEADRDFSGVCSFHGDCLEGLASATAMDKRFGNPADLPQEHIGWDIEAFYLAQACQTLSLTIRPEKIILGGGLMLAPHLVGKVRSQYTILMNSYLQQSPADIDDLILTPGLGDNAGLFGGACLAKSLVCQFEIAL